MFKVEHHSRGYRISTGDGRPAYARDLVEIQRALEHYYGGAGHQRDAAACPFCHQVAVVNERPVIKYQDCGCRIRAKAHTCGLTREE